MRYLRVVFNWGVKRDYLTENPIDKLDFEKVVKGDTEIFEPKIVQALLQDCLEHDLAFLPYRVLGFFCGIRPDGELHRLELGWHYPSRTACTGLERASVLRGRLSF